MGLSVQFSVAERLAEGVKANWKKGRIPDTARCHSGVNDKLA